MWARGNEGVRLGVEMEGEDGGEEVEGEDGGGG